MSSQAVTRNTEAAILARMLVPSDDAQLKPDAARYLLSIKLPSDDEERVNELSARARAGTLAESEKQELESYLHIGSLLAVLQSKARRLLKQSPACEQ